jgi:hypothetical protein
MADDFRVSDWFSARDLPEDQKQHAKADLPRKVGRLLERAFYAPFIAATGLSRRFQGDADPERFAVFTVSNWDPSIPIPDYAELDTPDRVERLSHFYTHPANPTDWLRRMPNNPLCNICITTGFRGPTMHYTGGSDSLAMLTTVAIATLSNGSASAAIVVAFDLPPGDEHMLAEERDSTASAVLLTGSGGGPAAEDLVASAMAAPPGTTAVAAMERFITAAEVGSVAGGRQ